MDVVCCLKNELPARADCAKKHGPIAMSTLCIIVTFGRVGGEIESMTKSLEINVFSNAPSVESRIGYPTDSTVCTGAWHAGEVAV
jgi:hypothetical protein